MLEWEQRLNLYDQKENLMKYTNVNIIFILFIIMATSFMVGCTTDAGIASRDLSKAVDIFEINRRVVFYKGDLFKSTCFESLSGH